MVYPNIDAERARHGLTVEELSHRLGVSRKTYYNWTKSGNIPQAKLKAMADFFGVSADYLLGRPVNAGRVES